MFSAVNWGHQRHEWETVPSDLRDLVGLREMHSDEQTVS